jgi:hypothetical protein
MRIAEVGRTAFRDPRGEPLPNAEVYSLERDNIAKVKETRCPAADRSFTGRQ